jgi:hypothetical protein
MPAFEKSPVFRILGLSARAPFNGDARDALAHLLAGGVDWDQLADQAKRHRLVAPLFESLKAEGIQGRVPADCLHGLGQWRRTEAASALMRAGLVARLAGVFRKAGVDALFLKGPALSHRLYGRPDVRGTGDVDVLLRPDHAERARLVLSNAGVVADGEGGAGGLHRFIHHEDGFRDLQTGVRVEVHRRLSANPHALPWDFDALWQARSHVTLGGEAVPVLSIGHEALFLIVHGAGHGWERLRWLADVAVLLRMPAALAESRQVAASVGMMPALDYTLELAQRWLGGAGAGTPARSRRLDAMVWAARMGFDGWGLPAPGLPAYVRVRLARYVLRQMSAPGWRCRGYDLLLGALKFAARLSKR